MAKNMKTTKRINTNRTKVCVCARVCVWVRVCMCVHVRLRVRWWVPMFPASDIWKQHAHIWIRHALCLICVRVPLQSATFWGKDKRNKTWRDNNDSFASRVPPQCCRYPQNTEKKKNMLSLWLIKHTHRSHKHAHKQATSTKVINAKQNPSWSNSQSKPSWSCAAIVLSRYHVVVLLPSLYYRLFLLSWYRVLFML